MTFSYDGSDFKGYQKQPRCRTVQGELEKVLKKINGDKEVSVTASGRTDAGVHAISQKAHFDLKEEMEPADVMKSMNSMLPDDIYIKNIEHVSDNFHARFNAIGKEYIYQINMGEYNPLERKYVYQYNKKLDVVEMQRAMKYLEGTHSFKAFSKPLPCQKQGTQWLFQDNKVPRLPRKPATLCKAAAKSRLPFA